MDSGDETDRLATLKREFRDIAREEARAVYNDLGAVDGDGREWTIRGLMEQFNIDRRTALQAIGLIALGYAAPTAVLHAVSGTARADSAGEVGTQADPLTKLWAHAIGAGDGQAFLGIDDVLAFNHTAISSATTVSNANVIRYDCSVSGFTITLGSDLEQDGLPVVLIDETSSAGTNSVTVDTQSGNGIDGGSSITISHSGAVTVLFWDGGEFRSTRFIDSVDAGEIANQNYVEPQVTASEGTSYNADLTAGNYHKVTMTGDVTFDFTNPDASDVNSLVLQLVQDGTGGRSPSFTPTVVWPGGSAPSWSTGANEEDVATFVHDQDGSQWLGFEGGLNFS